jgi:hypothetical protein
MKISKEVAQELFWEDNCDDYTFIESSKFESDGKWEHAYCIFQHNDKTYRFYVSRSGSYYTEYTYDWEYADEIDCEEVIKVEKVIEEWEAING